MKRIVCVAVLLFGLAQRMDAFDGREHAYLAECALEAAQHVVPPSAAMQNAIDGLRGSRWTFGDVVLGVDWFQNAKKLGVPGAKDAALRRRRWNYLMRGLAAHHNADHFQTGAVAAWRENHEAALGYARHEPECALLAEAVALHYLQDFFSAGHLTTPRKGMHDAAAGDLHDYFSDRGVNFQIASTEEMEAMLRVIAPADRERELYDAGIGDARFYGDGRLTDPLSQRLFVLAVSAFSIAEVFNATRDTPVELPVVELSARGRSAPRDEILSTKMPNVKGPDGCVRLAASHDGSASRCRDGAWLGRYLTEDDDELKNDYYGLSGFIIRADRSLGRRSAGERSLLEVRFFGMAQDPPDSMVDEKTGEPVRPDMPWIQMQLGSAGLSYIWGNGYRAWGFLWDLTYWTPAGGLSWSTRAGPRVYSYDDNNGVVRFDVGLKASLGLEIIGLTFGVDRSYEVDRNGRFGPAYFATFGLEFTAPQSWSRYAGPAERLVRVLVPNALRVAGSGN